jgi:hypothetical protein
MKFLRGTFLHLAAGAIALLAGSGVPTQAQVARLEVHVFPSMNLSDKQILLGRKDGTPVMIAGELRIPQPGAEKLPAIVLLQPSGGFGSNLNRWLPELNGMGITISRSIASRAEELLAPR